MSNTKLKEGQVVCFGSETAEGCGSEKGFDPWWALVGFGGLWWALVGLVGLVAPPFGHVRSARLVAIWGHRTRRAMRFAGLATGKGRADRLYS